MPTDVVMPQMGESIFEGTITKWLKKAGDTVQKDEPLFEISTDKVDAEIPSPVAGTLTEIKMRRRRNRSDQHRGSGHRKAMRRSPNPRRRLSTPHGCCRRSVKMAARTSSRRRLSPQAAVAAGTEVVMPQMGESIFEGTITKWLKKVGDTVQRDEPLFEISTDKVDAEIPSPVAGMLTEIKVAEGDTSQINTVVAVIGGSAPVRANRSLRRSKAAQLPQLPSGVCASSALASRSVDRRDA